MGKKCGGHPDSPAVAECGACSKPLCLMCVEEAPEGSFCSAACVEARRVQLRAQAAVAAAPAGSCVHHADSPAVARCKVCEKGICLLCLVEAPEGTFCSTKCLDVMKEVKGWVDEPSVPLSPDVPPPPAPAPASAPAPAEARAPSRVAFACAAHPEVKAEGRCARCQKPVCRTCSVVAAWGVFCSTACSLNPDDPAEAEAAHPRRKPVLAITLAVAGLVVAGVVAAIALKGGPEGPPLATAAPPPAPVPAAKPEPPKVEVPKAEPPAPKPEPVKPVPEPPKPEPPKPEPPKPEPPKPEPAPIAKPPPPPPPPEPAKPVAASVLRRAADPWIDQKPGSWFRVKTTEGGREGYLDVGLKERGPWYVVLVSQAYRGQEEPERHRWVEIAEARSVGDLRIDRPEGALALELVTLKGQESEVLWVVREGTAAGTVVKREVAGRRFRILKAGPERIAVRDRAFDCLRVETDEDGATVRRWLAAEVPLAALKAERPEGTEALVDWGADWSKRPPFPGAPVPVAKPEPSKPEPAPVATPEPPKPPPPAPPEDPAERARKRLEQAAARIREATPLYRDVAGADPLPTQTSELRALLARAEASRGMLREARGIYVEAKGASDDPGTLDRRIGQIDALLEALAKRIAEIEGVLK